MKISLIIKKSHAIFYQVLLQAFQSGKYTNHVYLSEPKVRFPFLLLIKVYIYIFTGKLIIHSRPWFTFRCSIWTSFTTIICPTTPSIYLAWVDWNLVVLSSGTRRARRIRERWRKCSWCGISKNYKWTTHNWPVWIGRLCFQILSNMCRLKLDKLDSSDTV